MCMCACVGPCECEHVRVLMRGHTHILVHTCLTFQQTLDSLWSLACHRTQDVGPSGIHRVTGTAMQLGPGDRTLQGVSQEGCCPGNVHCRTRLCCVWARPPLPQGSRLTCPCRGVRGQGIVTPLIRAPASVPEVSGQSPQGPAASKTATGRSP